MMLDSTPHQAQRAEAQRTAEQIAELLGLDLASGQRPRRMARMMPSGPHKYRDIPRSAPLTTAMLAQHMAARATYTATLDRGGLARSAAIDLDRGGRAAILAALAAAERLGLIAYGFLMDGPEHSGGHIWVFYAAPAPIADIAAQLAELLDLAGQAEAERWPNPAQPGQAGIRLPFGYHQRNHTRGQMITQRGEVFDLDLAPELAAAVELLAEAKRNPLPPPAPAPELLDLAVQASDNSHYTNLPERPITRSSVGERAAGQRLGLAELLAEAERYETLAELLARHGAEQRGGRGDTVLLGGLSGEQHTHDITYKISPRRNGSGQIGYSYSPNGALGTASFPRGFDYLAALAALDHAGDRLAAIRALAERYDPSYTRPLQNAPAPRPAAPAPADDRPEPERQRAQRAAEQLAADLDPAQRRRQAAEADRKRAERHRAAVELRAELRRRAASDTSMPAQARKMLAVHMASAGQNGRHTWSVATLAERAQLAERNAQLGNAYLIEQGYIARTPRGPKQTAIWTLCAEPAQRITAPQTAPAGVIAEAPAGSPVLDHELVHVQTHGASEGAAAEAPELLDLAAEVRRLAWQVDDPQRADLDLASMSAAELQGLAAFYRALLAEGLTLAEAPEQLAEALDLAPPHKLEALDLQPAPIAEPAGASYNPAEDWTIAPALGLSDKLPAREPLGDPAGPAAGRRPLARPERPKIAERKPVPAVEPVTTTTTTTAPSSEPAAPGQVEQRRRRAPDPRTDRVKRAQRWRGMSLGQLFAERAKLQNFTKCARFSAAQRAEFNEQLAELAHIIAIAEAAELGRQAEALGAPLAELLDLAASSAEAPALLDLSQPQQLQLLVTQGERHAQPTARPLAARTMGGKRLHGV